MIVGGIINIRSFSVANKMCSLVSQRLDHFISLPLSFLIHDSIFCILGAPAGSTSFVESFVAKVLHEDFETIRNLPMLTYLHVTFAMISLCYVEHLG
jgi:hypothetical protein